MDPNTSLSSSDSANIHGIPSAPPIHHPRPVKSGSSITLMQSRPSRDSSIRNPVNPSPTSPHSMLPLSSLPTAFSPLSTSSLSSLPATPVSLAPPLPPSLPRSLSTLAPPPLSSLPRESLSDRLGSRSVLVERFPSTTQSSTPVESNANPWDTEDPGTSGFEVKHELMSVKEEVGGSVITVASGKKSTKQVPADSTLHPTERKRILHLHAEQSRRLALKDGFDQLMEIVPDVHSGGIKPTNAVVLAKAADYIKALVNKKDEKKRRVEEVKEEIRLLQERIGSLQSTLPSSRREEGTKERNEEKAAIEQFFERYTKERSREDWRFWLMAHLLKPIVSSYASSVHGESSNRDELVRSVSQWMDSKWRVSNLRPLSSDILVYLATNTRVLQDPSSLREHIESNIGNK